MGVFFAENIINFGRDVKVVFWRFGECREVVDFGEEFIFGGGDCVMWVFIFRGFYFRKLY